MSGTIIFSCVLGLFARMLIVVISAIVVAAIITAVCSRCVWLLDGLAEIHVRRRGMRCRVLRLDSEIEINCKIDRRGGVRVGFFEVGCEWGGQCGV